MVNRISKIIIAIFALSLASVATAAPLQPRLGGLAFYDPDLDITWYYDASTNGNNGNWISQQNYITNVLNVDGVTGWRLPTAGASPLDCPGVSCADNEMGYMYYVRGITNVIEGVFINVLDGPYFSGTNSGTDVWWFSFLTGDQGLVNQNIPVSQFVAHTWAVHDGDVLPQVPLPAAVWMFGGAILGFMGIRRRRQA